MYVIFAILISLTIIVLFLIVLWWLFCMVDDCILDWLLKEDIKKKVERLLEDKEKNKEKH